MSDWRQLADDLRKGRASGTIGTKETEPPVEDSFVPIVPNVPTVLRCPDVILKEWHGRLDGISDDLPPAGFTISRWRQLVDDGFWLYETFASRAVRDGWSAHDLFGVHMGKPAWGGLVDRLRGSRNLEMTDCRAFWTHAGIRDQFNRGAATMLLPSGLTLLWEIK